HGIQRCDVPVGTKRKVDMVVQESAESVSAAGTIVANAAFGPAPVVDGVIGLHGGDHTKLGEAVEILRSHVLRVLDAETAICLAVFFDDIGVEIEDEIAWSPMACVHNWRPAASAFIMRSRIAAGGCISLE